VNAHHDSEENAIMTDIFKPIADDRSSTQTSASDPFPGQSTPANEAGRTVLIGLLGGIVSAAGYVIYSRLPDDQREKLHAQVRQAVDSRVNELRSRFNL